MPVEWTAERTRKLVDLWNEGLTTVEIGRRLDVTKNSVVGKAHRLDLPKRQSPVPLPPEGTPVIRLEALRAGMCSWPEGEPGTPDFRFCGKKPTIPGKPYCAEHCTRAYVRNSKDRKSSAAA